MAVEAMLLVAEQDLHGAQVDAVFDQPRCIAVAQHVRRDPPGDAGNAGGGSEGAGQHVVADRPGADAIGKQPAAVAVGQPHPAQFRQHRLRQRDPPFLVPFADDVQRQVGPVDRTDLKGPGLADAQAASVNDREAGFVKRAFYATEQMADLVVGRACGNRLCFGRRVFF